MLQEIYNFLAISLGTPPETFDFEYRDEEKLSFGSKSNTANIL